MKNQPQAPNPENPPTPSKPTLKTLLTEISQKQKFLAIPQQEYDPVLKTGIPGLTIARNEAQRELEVLEKAYEKRIGEVCARIFCVGGSPQALKEMKLVAEETGTIVVMANTLFEMIADKMLPHTSNPPRFTVTASMVMREELAKAYLRYAPDSTYPDVDMSLFDSKIGDDPVLQRSALAAITKQAAKRTASKPLAVTYAQEIAVRTTVDLRVDEEPLAIVILGLTADDIKEFEDNFFPGRPSEVINIDSAKNFEAVLKGAAKKLEKKLVSSAA